MALVVIAFVLIVILSIPLVLAPFRGLGVLKDHHLPELVMEILDVFTDRPLLNQLLEQQKSERPPPAFDVAAIARDVNNRIIGQTWVVDDLVEMIAGRRKKIRRRKPVAVVLLSGPPGTGKTELGKALGDLLPGSSGHYLIEMNKLKDAAALNSLFGAAPGYVGSDQKASLMRYLQDHPHSVIILDEFEKACPDAQNAFLAAWQEGYLRESTRYQKISTADAIFVLTANARQDEIRDFMERHQDLQQSGSARSLTSEEISDQIRSILRSDFPAPVLSRIDRVYAFAMLTQEALAAIALKILVEEITDYGLELRSVPPQVLIRYVNQYHGADFDTRDLYRHIERDFGKAASTLKGQGVKVVEIVYDEATESITVREATYKPAPGRPPKRPRTT